MYSIKFAGEFKDIKKAKGVGRTALASITFDTYRDVLLNKQAIMSKFNIITSKNHCLFSSVTNKLSLSCVDDKRQILDDGINTLPWGYL